MFYLKYHCYSFNILTCSYNVEICLSHLILVNISFQKTAALQNHLFAFASGHFAQLKGRPRAHRGMPETLLPVSFHMRVETTSFVETLSTHGTGVRLSIFEVRPPVLGQIAGKAEPASAVLALVPLFPRVNVHVVGEGALDAESFLAQSAHERLLSCVPPLVRNDLRPGVARIGAVSAAVFPWWPFHVHSSSVLIQVLLRPEALVTGRTTKDGRLSI